MKSEINVVSALIIYKGKILAVRRSSKTKNFPGMISFPGGKQEVGESITSAIKRELLEETGYSVEPYDDELLLGNIETSSERVNFYLVRCKIAGKREEVFDEMVEKVIWISPQEFLDNLESHGFYPDQVRKTRELFMKEIILKDGS